MTTPDAPPGPSRRSFLATGGAGLAMLLLGCGDEFDSAAADFDRSVIVVGAGPAGMTAAYHLARAGVDVRVVEAQASYGGRIRHDRDFADFPISLGAEWLHVEPDVLDELVGGDVEVTTELRRYDPTDLAGYYDGELQLFEMGDFADRKFIDSSWLDTFETYVLPTIESVITFNTPIAKVDTSGEGVVLTDAAGDTHEADRVIVTVPLKLLQLGEIEFVPPLPEDRRRAIESADIWSGIKVFVEFTETFWPAFLEGSDGETLDGQRAYYDASYGQRTGESIIGLFAVGAQADSYLSLDDEALIQRVLDELDVVFGDEVASATYVKHLIQRWNDEPFARAAYLADVASSSTSTTLSGPVGDTLYFAGDAYTSFDDWSSVHTAIRSAIEAVTDMVA
ncbi:MAG: NAD(P)/FAD-dependent oxidoreductase [Actinomycetota bacterium]